MRILALIIFILISLACSKPEENFVRIPSEFYASVFETIKTNGERSLHLELSSKDKSYCESDSLIISKVESHQGVHIEILESYKANSCITRNFALNSVIDLPDFTDTLNLTLVLGSASTIRCMLVKLEKEYKFIIVEGSGITGLYEQTFKISDNLLWGYAYPIATDPTCESMMNNLVKAIEFDCSTNWLKEGFYSYFLVGQSNHIEFRVNPGIAGNHKKFYYTHNWSEEQMTEFFQQLSSDYANLVGFRIQTGSGKEFISN